MEYKTVMIEEVHVYNATQKIDEKIQEMSNQGFELVTFSFLGTQRVVFVFKKL